MTGREVVDLVFALSIPITIIVFWIWQKLSHQKGQARAKVLRMGK